MLGPIFAALACILSCLALVTVDDPAAGRRAAWRTWVAVACVVVSVTYLALRLAGVGPFEP